MRKVKPYLLISLLLAAEGCSTGHVISFNDHGTGGTGRTASNSTARPNLNIGQNARNAGTIISDPIHVPGPFPTPFPNSEPPKPLPTPTPPPPPLPPPTPRPTPIR